MSHSEAEQRVVLAATRDAELHQQRFPGEVDPDAWGRERWSVISGELADAASLLGEGGPGLYLAALRDAVRVLSKLVTMRIEQWLDLALPAEPRRALTVDEVNALNQRLSVRDRMSLFRAGGAEAVCAYTRRRYG